MFKAIARFFRVTMLWVLILPTAVTYIGAASNQLVLIANHDKFPVMENAYLESQDDIHYGLIDPQGHCLMTKDTHLNFLADIFDFKDGIYSVGDGLIELGDWLNSFCVFVWIALVIQKLRSTTKEVEDWRKYNSERF